MMALAFTQTEIGMIKENSETILRLIKTWESIKKDRVEMLDRISTVKNKGLITEDVYNHLLYPNSHSLETTLEKEFGHKRERDVSSIIEKLPSQMVDRKDVKKN